MKSLTALILCLSLGATAQTFLEEVNSSIENLTELKANFVVEQEALNNKYMELLGGEADTVDEATPKIPRVIFIPDSIGGGINWDNIQIIPGSLREQGGMLIPSTVFELPAVHSLDSLFYYRQSAWLNKDYELEYSEPVKVYYD